MASRPMTTLSGRDYTSAEVFDLERDAPQAELVAVELVLAHVGRADQPTVEGVRPCVVRALDGPLHAAGHLVAEPRAAVAADVVEAAKSSIQPTHENQRLTDQFSREVVTGLSNLAGMADDLPCTGEDFLFFEA